MFAKEEKPARFGQKKSVRSQEEEQSLRRGQPVRIQKSLRGEENVAGFATTTRLQSVSLGSEAAVPLI